ncbi:MAG: DVU0298 family protein [Thermodesulfobacteriota bacterium]
MKKPTIKTRPWCPFCGQDVGRPLEPVQRKMDEFKIGECQCGAIYTSDPTGFNVGAAMVECMVAAAGDNADLAFDMDPDEDYQDARLDNYDEQDHYVYELMNVDGRKVRGVLYFIRLNKDLAELSKKIEGHRAVKSQKIAQSAIRSFEVPSLEPQLDPKRQRKKAKKREIQQLVKDGDIDTLVAFCLDDHKTLRFIQRMLYDPFEEKRWLYAHIMGQVCARVSTRKPGMVSDLLHRMFESCTDSAASHWGILEAIGSIIAARADLYGAFARHLLMYRGVPETRVAVLWALGTIAATHPQVVRDMPIYAVFDFVNHRDPATRGHAIRLFGRINAMEVRHDIEQWLDDENELTIYEGGQAQQTTVAKLTTEAIEIMGTLSKDGKPAPLTLGNVQL